MTYHSQYRQDRIIDRLFRKRDGVFVEIGAYDGVTYSNTYFFERERGWRGICIEPVPESYARLSANRECVTVHGCVSDSGGVKTLRCCHACNCVFSGLVDFQDERHLDRIESAIAEDGGAHEEIDVRCYTLGELLDEHGLAGVDYCSIDTEGGELEILRSIDFEKYDFRSFSVEDNYRDRRIIEFLEGKGYSVLGRSGCDLIFVKGLFRHLKWPVIAKFVMIDRLKRLFRAVTS